jgi:hypothetical protein
MSAITLDTNVVRADGLFSTDLDDETILMSIEQGAYYGMEQTARRTWDLLATPQKVSQLCTRIAEEYKVAPEVCTPDILVFLEELLHEGLIVTL